MKHLQHSWEKSPCPKLRVSTLWSYSFYSFLWPLKVNVLQGSVLEHGGHKLPWCSHEFSWLSPQLYLFIFFCSTGDWIQGPVHARKVLYFWGLSTSQPQIHIFKQHFLSELRNTTYCLFNITSMSNRPFSMCNIELLHLPVKSATLIVFLSSPNGNSVLLVAQAKTMNLSFTHLTLSHLMWDH